MLVEISESIKIYNQSIEVSGSALIEKSFKPIFHCDAKYLASGVGVEQCTRRQNCALPNAKYTNMLVYFALGEAHFRVLPDAKPKSCVLPDAKPKRKPVEYRLRWVPGVGSLRWACTFHIFCVDFICVG